MTKNIECIKIEHKSNYVWLVSVGGKLLGEVKELKSIKSQLQQFDLQLNWLILDTVADNFDYLVSKLKLDKKDSELQLNLETYVRKLIAEGEFSNQIFKDRRQTIDSLFSARDDEDRLIEVVMIGLKYRYIKSEHINVTGNNKGYIQSTDVSSGKIKIGLSASETEQLLSSYWLTESLLRKINVFLNSEYTETEYQVEQESSNGKEASTEVKKSQESVVVTS